MLIPLVEAYSEPLLHFPREEGLQGYQEAWTVTPGGISSAWEETPGVGNESPPVRSSPLYYTLHLSDYFPHQTVEPLKPKLSQHRAWHTVSVQEGEE